MRGDELTISDHTVASKALVTGLLMLKAGVLVAEGVDVATTVDAVRIDCVEPCATKCAITAKRNFCCRIVRILRNVHLF